MSLSPIHPRALFRDLYPRQFVSGETGSLSGLKLITARVNLPVIVIRCQYQSASPSLLPGVCGKLLPRMMRSPLRALLGSLSRRYSRDHSRRALNSFGLLEAARSFLGHSALYVCQDTARKFADLLHFNLSAPSWGLVAVTDGHSNSERKSACPNQDGTNPY